MATFFQPTPSCMVGTGTSVTFDSWASTGSYVTIPVVASSAITSPTTIIIQSVGNHVFGVPDVKISIANEWQGNKIEAYRALMEHMQSRNVSSTSTISITYQQRNTCGLSAEDYAAITCILGKDGMSLRQQTPEDRMRKIIEERQAPMVFTTRYKAKNDPLPDTTDQRELRARELIRRILGEHHYQNLREKGFVAIKAKSGKTYILRPGYSQTTVYEGGRRVASLCIQLKGKFPPCDALAMRAMLLWNNEDEFWRKANAQLFKDTDPLPIRPNPLHGKTLVEHFADLKAGRTVTPFTAIPSMVAVA